MMEVEEARHRVDEPALTRLEARKENQRLRDKLRRIKAIIDEE